MENIEKVYKKNTLFIILIGIVGFCFGLLDWDSNLVDLVYLKYNNAFLVSIISANLGVSKLIATLLCIKANSSQRPNFIFNSCLLLSTFLAIIVAICFDNEYIVLFVITYLLEILVLEIFSGYHYAYAYNSLPEDMAMNAHSKRISVFKLMQAGGIAIAGFICATFMKHTFLILSFLGVFVFCIAIIFTNQVKNFPKENSLKQENLIQKLNIFCYTKYFRKWLLIRFLGKLALSSLVVLLSVRAIDNGQNVMVLKTVKSLLWLLSGIGFFFSGYFIRKKMIVNGDVFVKGLIASLIPFVFVWPNVIFLIILLTGVLNPFNTMSHLEMLRMDNDKIGVPQKDMVINLAAYVSQMLSSYIFLNINNNLALICITVLLFVSVFLEYLLYRKTKISRKI